MLHQGEPLKQYFEKRFNEDRDDISNIAINVYTQDVGETPSFVSTSTEGGFINIDADPLDFRVGLGEIEVNISVKELCQKLIKASQTYYENNKQEFSGFKGLFNWDY